MMKSKVWRSVALLVAGVAIASASMAANMLVLVKNESSHEVWTIRTSSADSGTYGTYDVLEGSVIPAGGQKIINFDVKDAQGSCVQDLIAETQDRTTGRWRIRMNTCTSATWTLRN